MIPKKYFIERYLFLFLCFSIYYLLSIMFHYFLNPDFRYSDIKILSVSATKSATEYLPKEGGSVYSIFNKSPETWWYGYTTTERPNILDIQFKSTSDIDRIIINSNSRIPIDFEVNCNPAEGTNKLIVNDNEKSQIILDFPETICRRQKNINITFTKTKDADHLLRINELSIQGRSSNYEQLLSAKNHFSEYKCIFIYILCVMIGTFIINKIRLVLK